MTEVDLITDAGFDAGKPVQMVIHIIKQGGHFGVILDGEKADGLVWEEMLGQIAELTHPKLGEARYAMFPRVAIEANDRHRAKIMKSKKEQP